MAAVIAPWTVRNYGTTGHFVLVSSGTSDAFLRGMIFSRTQYITLQKPPFTDAENASNAYFKGLASQAGTVWERDDYETDQILNREAKRRRPRGTASGSTQVCRRAIHLLVPADQPDELAPRPRVRRRCVDARDHRVAAGAPRAPPGLAPSVTGLVPEHPACLAPRTRPILGARLSGAARRLGVRRRHAARTMAAPGS